MFLGWLQSSSNRQNTIFPHGLHNWNVLIFRALDNDRNFRKFLRKMSVSALLDEKI